MKKIIIIASSILIVILIVISLLTNLGKNNGSKTTISTTTPTSIPETYKRTGNTQNEVFNRAISYTPYEEKDFKFDYDFKVNKFVVFEKNQLSKEAFIKWSNLNNIAEIATDNQSIIYYQNGNSSINTSREINQPIVNLLNLFYSFGKGAENQTNQSNSNNTNQPSNISTTNDPVISQFKYTYYPQCDSEYADLSLPSGCNFCQAGCGPATVAMIISSYLGQNNDPKTIINKYQALGFELGCDGSRYIDAKSIIESYGLKTTDFLVFEYEPSEGVSPLLKKYTDAGWTFFTLANFTDEGGGHYFWITDIDNQGNIWAYDPFYGRFQAPPFNENSRSPYPYYRLAFGVKK